MFNVSLTEKYIKSNILFQILNLISEVSGDLLEFIYILESKIL